VEEKDFIESGILELYILDALSPEERAEVERYRSTSALVAAELRRIEAAMELFALENGVESPDEIKAVIEKKLNFNSASDSITGSSSGNGPVYAERSEVPAVPLQAKNSHWSYYALAACLTLLLISSGGAYSLWSKLKVSRTDYTDLLNKTNRYSNQVAFFKGELTRSKNLIDNPDFKKLPLLGTRQHSSSLAVVWWNKKKHTVFIDPNGLGSTDATHSYQLWAIAKGKPVDAGVFEVKSDFSSLAQMNDVVDAQAFAVTLEPKGGSKAPTMSEMYVMSTI